MLKLWNFWIMNWVHVFHDPSNAITHGALFKVSVLTAPLLSIVITMVYVIKSYRETLIWRQQLKNYQTQLDVMRSNVKNFDVEYNRDLYRDKIKASLWSDQTSMFNSMLKVLVRLIFNYLICVMGIFFGYLLTLTFVCAVLYFGEILWSSVVSIYPSSLALNATLGVLIILFLIGFRRNKPQWLKLMLVIAAMLCGLALIFEVWMLIL